MLPSDSSELQAYIMKHNRMTQAQAQAWLDKWVPHWRTEEPNEPVGVIEYSGDDNEE